MNTQKYKMSNCGLLREADRSMYENRDSVSRSLIDKDKTKDNYNLCRHEQYSAAEIRSIQERIRGKRMRKDAVAFGSTIVTLPKDYEGDPRDFFQAAYQGLKGMYRLREQDVVSAYVHMDETTPHMHFYFLPIHREGDRECVSWDKTIPRAMYQKQHRELQEFISARLGREVLLENGKTLGITDINKLSAFQKQQGLEARQAVQEAERRREMLLGDINDLEQQKTRQMAELEAIATQFQTEVAKMADGREMYEKQTQELRELQDKMTALLDNISDLEFKRLELEREYEADKARLREMDDRVEALSRREDIKYPKAPLSRDKVIVPEEDIWAYQFYHNCKERLEKREREIAKREENQARLEKQAQAGLNSYNEHHRLNQELRQERERLQENVRRRARQEVVEVFDALGLSQDLLQKAYRIIERSVDMGRER